jgi:hypothetical protein
MVKKLVIFLGAAAAAAIVASAVTRKRRDASETPLLEMPAGKSKLADDWRSDDALSTELAGVVADEVAAAR